MVDYYKYNFLHEKPMKTDYIMKTDHLNTPEQTSGLILQSLKQNKQGFYKDIITNLPNGDDSK